MTLDALRRAVDLMFAYSDLVGQESASRLTSNLPASREAIENACALVYVARRHPNGQAALRVLGCGQLLDDAVDGLLFSVIGSLPEFLPEEEDAVRTAYWALLGLRPGADGKLSQGAPNVDALVQNPRLGEQWTAIQTRINEETDAIWGRLKQRRWQPIQLPDADAGSGPTASAARTGRGSSSSGCAVLLTTLAAALTAAAFLVR